MDLFIDRTEEVEVVEEKTYVDNVEVDAEYEGIKVIGICALIDVLFPDYWGNPNYTYTDTNKAVMDWCEVNDAHYYADVRENFWIIGHGVREAKEAGKSVVVVEDLS